MAHLRARALGADTRRVAEQEFTALYDNKIESKVLPGFNKKE